MPALSRILPVPILFRLRLLSASPGTRDEAKKDESRDPHQGLTKLILHPRNAVQRKCCRYELTVIAPHTREMR
jgi:hypothetical protein